MKTKTKATVIFIFAILLLELFGAPFFYRGVKAQQYHSFDYSGYSGNSCLSFDGKSSYVTFSHDPNYQAANLTIEEWIKPAYTISPSGNQYGHTWGIVAERRIPYWGGWYLGFDYDNGMLYFDFYYNGGSSHTGLLYHTTRSVWFNNSWYYVAVTYNPTLSSSNLNFYVNGLLDANYTEKDAVYYYDAALLVGADSGQSQYGGLVDEFRYWNVSRSTAEIQIWWNKTERAFSQSANSSLVGYWRFDDGSGSYANDSSLYNSDPLHYNPGSLVNNPQWVTPGAPICYWYDINTDGKIDGKDIALAALAFGTVPGDPRWNPRADIYEKGKIDGPDIATPALHFGQI